MNIVKADLFEYIKDKANYIIPHVTNTRKVMGAGFAKVLKEKFPEAESIYLAAKPLLGTTSIAVVGDNIYVANMTAQTLSNEARRLQYNFLAQCMDKVAAFCDNARVEEIIAPSFGSGLAGGKEEIINELIFDCWERKKLKVTICKL